MEVMMLRANVIEDREATMSRFLGGLSREIQDVVEMQNCVGLEAMLHKAVLAEQQLNRKGSSRFGSNSLSQEYSRDSKPVFTPKHEPRSSTSYQDKGKGKADVTPTTSAREVKCFKCQGFGHYAIECTNRRVMIIRDNGEIESEEEPTPKTVQDTEEYEAVPVRDEVCSLITDGGSYTNVASETMVKKLGLRSQKHSSANDQELGPELEPNQEAEDHGEPKPKQPKKTLSNLYQGTKGESIQTPSCDLQEIVQVPSNDKVHARLPQIVYNDSMSFMMHLLFSKSVETGTGSSEEQWKQADQEKESQSDQIPPESKPPDQQLQGLGVTRKETNEEELPTQVPNPKSAESTFSLIIPKEIRSEPHIQPDPGKCLQSFSISKTHEFSNVAGRIGLNLKLSNKKIRSEITISVEKAPNDELDHEFNPEPNNKWKSKTEQGYSQAMSTAKLSAILNQHIHPVFLTVLMHLSWFKEVEKGTAEQERRLEAHKALTCHTKEEYEQHVLEPIAAADSLMSVLHSTQARQHEPKSRRVAHMFQSNSRETTRLLSAISKKQTQGKYLDSQRRMRPNLLSFGAGKTVLRTKLFEEREDDMIMASAKVKEHGPKLEPDGVKDLKLEPVEQLEREGVSL
ncbi:unnamed protein product [Microthlaspi erraticum]|uniref:CCHC-type domain-containing protein n=1 Tax=Microthlaspi erraticum TaxID=1685480 RepID=A0A6D2LKY4_9BRAS|nr:unnamed protein product [Microthlaspi erraticum]